VGFASPPVAQPAPYGVTETAEALIAAGWKFSGRSVFLRWKSGALSVIS